MTIPEKIYLARESKKISRKQISNFLEISLSTYSKLERGEIELSVNRLIQISTYLDMNICFFFDSKCSIKNGIQTKNSDLIYLSKLIG